MIAIEGLGFRFQGSQQHALCNVDLLVEPGEFLIITGPSGCGKSTLALAIGGYLFRQYEGEAEGAVNVAGMDVRQCPIYDVAEVVGLVQQNPEAQFCTLTVQDEVAFGLENRCLPRDDIWSRIDWALSIVGARHLLDRQLATLSGGEKQKVAIAAIMATKPQVLIFDEPTSNLDPAATAEVFEVIAHIRARAGITVIVIEHKVDYLLRFEPRLVTMERGSIVYDGPFDERHLPKSPSTRHRSCAQMDVARAPKDTVRPPTRHAEPAVRMTRLHAGYDGRQVLLDLSLELWPGEFVAVMGDNGSGKTTFLQTMLGLLKPEQGRVEVLGQNIRRTPVSSLARQVGFVFQNPDHQLFAETVWQEATFTLHNFGALDQAAQERVEELLARCNLGERRRDHPYRLSYGEKRRLNLISMLAYRPQLILLDEILIGQDAGNAAFLLELLAERVEQGDTVVMVNHAPEITMRYASRLLFFNDGKVLVDEPTDEGFRRLDVLGRGAYLPQAGRWR